MIPNIIVCDDFPAGAGTTNYKALADKTTPTTSCKSITVTFARVF